MNALPALLFSDVALMCLVGVNAPSGTARGVPTGRCITTGAAPHGAHLSGCAGG
jgi:hypothetical protein